MENTLLFALDIGTRSVVGLVGEQVNGSVRLLAVDRQEHQTRAMLDGQIHDVPEVANVLSQVKNRLEQTCGPLKKVSIAAAGRALCTIRSHAELEVNGRTILAAEDENTLELAAIQAAQHQLATTGAVNDPTGYYCVGFSIINFWLDDTPIKTIVGQRGKIIKIEIIATFLPRQVIDSLQSAVQSVGLEIATLTLEPIAAINVLIPPTMRHINLTLVDVGAGTSDVAVTRDGTVIGYGMVPCAGDEITEALSKRYLLDFNVAEKIKRKLNGATNKKLSFTDILGMPQKVSANEIIDEISPTVAELAQAIATQILALNTTAPQAVLLVGGGSLTPLLPEFLAQALDIPTNRVAIRRPDVIDGVTDVPKTLCTPDAVTPLGILKLAGGRMLNFISVVLNDQPVHLFNLGKLTIADALLAAGLDVRTLQGRPGMGITVSINGQTKFIPGSHGKPGRIERNGEPAALVDSVNESDVIVVTSGQPGVVPNPMLKGIAPLPEAFSVTIDGKVFETAPIISINGIAASPTTKLTDRDQVICRIPSTLGEVLEQALVSVQPTHFTYIINGNERTYTTYPEYLINGRLATLSVSVEPEDLIRINKASEPTVGEVLGLTADKADEAVAVLFNKKNCLVPVKRYTYTINGRSAALTDKAPDGSILELTSSDQAFPSISDVLLAARFNPKEIPASKSFSVLLNGRAAEYTSVVKNGDAVDVVITDSKKLFGN